jgi:hypothetical protein
VTHIVVDQLEEFAVIASNDILYQISLSHKKNIKKLVDQPNNVK